MIRFAGAAAVALLFVATVPSARACGSGETLLEDTFTTLQPVWGKADENMSQKGGELIVNTSDGEYYTVLSETTFKDVDYCATVKLVKTSKLDAAYGGITFLARDYDDFYTFQITLDGYATAYHYKDGDWTALIEDKETKSVRKAKGALNELRVVTRGGSATLYVNGNQFGIVSGDMPEGGQRIGFTTEAPEGGSATFALDNVRVNAPSGN